MRLIRVTCGGVKFSYFIVFSLFIRASKHGYKTFASFVKWKQQLERKKSLTLIKRGLGVANYVDSYDLGCGFFIVVDVVFSVKWVKGQTEEEQSKWVNSLVSKK